MPRDAIGTDIKTTPFWWEDAPLPGLAEPPAAETDVAVIGAGYTGLSAALTLARAGRSVQVLEAETPGMGASTRNGGMLSDLLKPGLGTLTKRYGRDRALALMREARAAQGWLEAFIAEEGIACDYARSGGFAGALRPTQYEAMARDLETVRKALGDDGEMVPKAEVRREVGTDLYVGGRLSHRRGGLNPARYHAGLLQRALAAGVRIAGYCKVTAVRRDGGFRLETPHGPVAARDVFVATNGYTGPATPLLRRRVIPVTSSIIATEELQPALMAALMPKGRMLTDSNRLLCYFRPSPNGRRVLFGGRPAYHDIGPDEAARRLRAHMVNVFPELRDVALTHSWSGNIGYTFDRLPHTGVTDGMHYAMGYCGSGVVMSSWLGRKAALRLLAAPDARSAFADLEHPTMPFYTGRPWFLPLVQAWYQGFDMIGR